MRVLLSLLIALLVVSNGKVMAFGLPNYLPDGAHPRIFLTPTVVTALQAKVAANDQDWLDLKARADVLVTYSVPAYDRNSWPNNSIPYAYQGGQWLEAAQVLGLAYKMTANAAYAAKLKELIDVIVAAGTTPITVDSGYPSRTVAFAMALMYDWLYDYLDAPTKASMISTINAYYASYVAGAGWYNVAGPAYDNYFGGHLLGFGTCALATYGDNATAPAMMADIRAKWDSTVPASFASGGFAGGANLESYNYGPNHFIRLIQFGVATQTATGEDIYSTYGAKIADNLLYNLKPNRWQSTDEGDMPGSFSGVMPSNLPIVLSGFTPGTAGDQMAYFYANLASTPDTNATNTIQKADPFTRFLFKIPRTQSDYRLTKPLVYRSSGDEHVFMRSSWTDSAVWSSYAAGNIRWTGHETNKAGHIAIQRGTDYLLVNSGQWKGQDGLTGSPSNFNSASQWTNTLYFNDGGAYQYTGSAYLGGQMSLFPDINAVLAYETNTNYTYVKADHTNAYDIRAENRNPAIRSLRYFYRNFVYLNQGTFVVYDRVKALQASFIKKLYWHLNKNGQPVALDSKTTSSTVGSSRLFIKSVFPSTSIVSFGVDITDGSTGAAGGITTPRVEIADATVSTDFNPLSVLIADSNTATMPITEQVLSTVGTMIGTYIKDATNPNVVMFSNDPNNGDVTGNVTYTISAPAGGVSPWHTIVHMPANTYYTVVRPINSNVAQTYQLLMENDPAKGTVIRTSSQGVLRIPPDITIQPPTTTPTTSASGGGGGGGCFIATAAYGSYLHPQVQELRNFRDTYLLTNRPGRAFVALYYHFSPPIADFIAQHETFRLIVRLLLTPIVLAFVNPELSILIILLVPVCWVIRRRWNMKEPVLDISAG